MQGNKIEIGPNHEGYKFIIYFYFYFFKDVTVFSQTWRCRKKNWECRKKNPENEDGKPSIENERRPNAEMVWSNCDTTWRLLPFSQSLELTGKKWSEKTERREENRKSHGIDGSVPCSARGAEGEGSDLVPPRPQRHS